MSIEDAIRTIVRNEVRVVMEQLRAASAQGTLFPQAVPAQVTPEPPPTPPAYLSREAVKAREDVLIELASRKDGVTPTEALPVMKAYLKQVGWKRKIGRNYIYQFFYKLVAQGKLITVPNTDKNRGSVGHGRLPGEYVYYAPEGKPQGKEE